MAKEALVRIVGRHTELEEFSRIKASNKSEFVGVYGRRRVGKTFLVREFFDYIFDFHLTGLANATTSQQLGNFQIAFQTQFDRPLSKPTNWVQAFGELSLYLDKTATEQKKIIFLDELPWLDTPRSDFLIALEHFWNSWATMRNDIILIGCGSAASWMINKLINNKGGLHNRITARIKIHPFTLKETEELLHAKGCQLDRYQILKIYMVMGGIPYYLDHILPGKSAAQNIELLCFTKGALLTTEFHNLFGSLFNNAERHEGIVVALSSKTKGLTRQEIAKQTSTASGGGLTRTLLELEESGFVERVHHFNRTKRDSLYRLSDFFSAFHLKFIRDNTNFSPGVWTNGIDHPSRRAWSGFAFEQVCLAHIPQIKTALGIGGVTTDSASWRSAQEKPRAQIDLVIDRRDHVINLCEMKYSLAPFKIDKSYAQNLLNKINSFRQETNTPKSLFLTFVTTFGLLPNTYSIGLVQNQIEMDALYAN